MSFDDEEQYLESPMSLRFRGYLPVVVDIECGGRPTPFWKSPP
jgi:hypothetical protein